MSNEPNKNRNGVGYDGRSKNVGPGNPTLLVHHDPNVPRASDGVAERASGNIARAGKAKAFHPVSVHVGMTERQTDMLGMGHALGSAPDASAANPLAPEPLGKHIAPVPVSPGMRSRTMDTLHSGAPGENHARNKGAHLVDPAIGAAIIREGLSYSAPDDRAALAHLGGSALPLTTKSK